MAESSCGRVEMHPSGCVFDEVCFHAVYCFLKISIGHLIAMIPMIPMISMVSVISIGSVAISMIPMISMIVIVSMILMIFFL